MEYREEKLSRAISASSRRKILRLLSDKEFTVKEIASQTQMSVSLASRHLKMLYDLGFLSVRKKFPNKFYSLKIKELKILLDSYNLTLVNLSGTVEEKEEKLSRAIGADSRRQILRLLVEKELMVKEIASKIKKSASLASRHLKLLHDLGFLIARKKFPNKFYSLKIKELKALLSVYDLVINKL